MKHSVCTLNEGWGYCSFGGQLSCNVGKPLARQYLSDNESISSVFGLPTLLVDGWCVKKLIYYPYIQYTLYFLVCFLILIPVMLIFSLQYIRPCLGPRPGLPPESVTYM